MDVYLGLKDIIYDYYNFCKYDWFYVLLFVMLGLFVLFIVSINFMNLFIVWFMYWVKEVGVRKIIGVCCW